MKHRPHRGFALVVTLTLLVILTVVAVGMLGLSTVSLRSNSQGESMATARANARMAMMLALGELQKELGPDQRISAPGLHEFQDDKTFENEPEPGPSLWTGVYESWISDSWPIDATKNPNWPIDKKQEILEDDDRNKAFSRWLISGDQTLVEDKELASNGLPKDPENVVTLVAKTDAKDGIPAREKVEAMKITTKRSKGDAAKGAFAWWVGDQNTKAKLGGVVEDAKDTKEAAARLQSAPRAAHEVLPGLESVEAKDERLGKLPSTKTLQLLAKDADFFHDVTTTSLGLLTNVRAGGLRRDLNFLLETPSPTIRAPLYSAERKIDLYPKSPGVEEPPYLGINFSELWIDHNVWGELQPKDSSTDNSPPMLTTKPNKDTPGDTERKDIFISYKHVPRLQVKLIYSLVSQQSSPGKYNVRLVVEPIYTIWNPYDVHLYVDPDYFATFKTHGIPYNLTLKSIDNTGKLTFHEPKSIKELATRLKNDGTANTDGGAYAFLIARLGKNKPLILKPGEVLVMGQGAEKKSVELGAGEDDGRQFDCEPGYSFGAGFLYEANLNEMPLNADDTIQYKLEPNSGRDANVFYNFSYYIGTLPYSGPTPHFVGGFVTDLVNSRIKDQDVFANDPDLNIIFPTYDFSDQYEETVSGIEISVNNSEKWPICALTYGVRTEMKPSHEVDGKRFTGRSMLRANPSASAYDLFDLKGDGGDILRTSPLQFGMKRLEGASDVAIVPQMRGNNGFFGAGYETNQGVPYVITRSIPREPIHSLGALQHGAAEGRPTNNNGIPRNGQRSWYLQPSVSHAIANSFAPSFLEPDEVRGTLASRPAADHSYLANLALWDTYFYSSIKPRTKPAYRSEIDKDTKAYDDQKERLEKFLATGIDYKPLPNERMRPWTSDPAAVIKAIFPSSKPASNAADRTASFLMVDGMFNVNSTSVEAWKSFLSGLRKAKVPSNPSPDLVSQPKMVEAEGTAVAALLEAAGEEIDDSTLGDPSDPEQWRGFRSLRDEQIEELAKAIVKQVRKRGPFLSIADFVNRRPGPDKDLAVSGALQSALDDATVSINEAYRQGDRSLSVDAAKGQGFPFPEAEAGPKAIGSPGYVKQGDLLTTLGPMVAVRGDTFVIRGYGEAREGNGPGSKVAARAWCEVTVQRVPEYVDPANNSYDAPTALNDINKTFGRRFNIVSFRYLDPREVL